MQPGAFEAIEKSCQNVVCPSGLGLNVAVVECPWRKVGKARYSSKKAVRNEEEGKCCKVWFEEGQRGTRRGGRCTPEVRRQEARRKVEIPISSQIARGGVSYPTARV